VHAPHVAGLQHSQHVQHTTEYPESQFCVALKGWQFFWGTSAFRKHHGKIKAAYLLTSGMALT
jgi:hypothetical protein